MAKASGLIAKRIPMDKIHEPGAVVRMEIDPEEIQKLADNIAEIGLLQPIMVRAVGGHFEIIDGHRRFLAHNVLERRAINCTIVTMDDIECAVARGCANVWRLDITPIEEAAIYADLRDNHELTINEIGKRMSKSPGVVKRRLDLLRMPPQLQKAVHLKQINYSVAEELWSLGDESDIDYFLVYAVDHGATQAVVRGWVKGRKDERRREQSGTGGGGGPQSPMETRPSYVPCDLCLQAMELGSETLFRTCPQCSKSIIDAVKGQG